MSRLWKEREIVENAIAQSRTLKQSLHRLGLRSAGGNFKTIQKYISLYQIDISHFETASERNSRCKQKISLDLILVENSTYNRTHLKIRLYKEGLKTRYCELCGQGEEWRGKKMSLILDHINGVWNDNRFENLRIVCPNCNATLETHCGKNMMDEKITRIRKPKIVLEKQIDTQPKIDGRKLPRLSRRTVERPPLDQLLQEIQDMGYSATGRKYGVSDNAIRKWVKK